MKRITENGLSTDFYTSKRTGVFTTVLLDFHLTQEQEGYTAGFARIIVKSNDTGVETLGLRGVDCKGVEFVSIFDNLPLDKLPSPDAIIKFIFRVAKDLLAGDPKNPD